LFKTPRPSSVTLGRVNANIPPEAVRFETYRSTLLNHACRMLGERAEAEDAVQDAYLRWHMLSAKSRVRDERAYLRATVTRLCIDRLRSARMRHEAYIGVALPEPLLASSDNDPAVVTALAEDVSLALSCAFAHLSPLERAAFLLHDVMGISFSEIARTLERTEAAVKQLASRARTRVRKPCRLANDLTMMHRMSAVKMAIRDRDLEAVVRLTRSA
jgi:RNA polymerase sigma-70 factor, ECF subfamily